MHSTRRPHDRYRFGGWGDEQRRESTRRQGVAVARHVAQRYVPAMRPYALFLLALLPSGCLLHSAPALPPSVPQVEGKAITAFALRYVDVAAGVGTAMAPKACIYAHYTGWLTNGTKFDSSRDTMPNGQPRTPIAFAQGGRTVIAAWDAGFEGMRVGGRRRDVRRGPR